MVWDKCFTDGAVSEEDKAMATTLSNKAKLIACAKVAMAWGLCQSGETRPDNFGKGIIELSKWSGLDIDQLLPHTVMITAKSLENCELVYKPIKYKVVDKPAKKEQWVGHVVRAKTMLNWQSTRVNAGAIGVVGSDGKFFWVNFKSCECCGSQLQIEIDNADYIDFVVEE